MNKPHLVVPLDSGITMEAVGSIIDWLRQHSIKALNIAGPRESKRPGIYRLTRELLEAVDVAIHFMSGGRRHLESTALDVMCQDTEHTAL